MIFFPGSPNPLLCVHNVICKRGALPWFSFLKLGFHETLLADLKNKTKQEFKTHICTHTKVDLYFNTALQLHMKPAQRSGPVLSYFKKTTDGCVLSGTDGIKMEVGGDHVSELNLCCSLTSVFLLYMHSTNVTMV